MIEPSHLLVDIIRPVLESLGFHRGDAARLRRDSGLILGTACAESDCGRWLRQFDGGPAIGVWQMEPETYGDCWTNYLDARPILRAKILDFASSRSQQIEHGDDGVVRIIPPPAEEMIGNLPFACAMARIKYFRDPETIPDTLHGQAEYWKKVYNTEKGAGTAEKYLQKWDQFIGRGGQRFSE